jgi:hypothetical protein
VKCSNTNSLKILRIEECSLLGFAPCRACVNRRFGGTYRLHLQGRKIRELGTSVSRWLPTEPPIGGFGRRRPGEKVGFGVSRIQNKRLTTDCEVNGRDLFHDHIPEFSWRLLERPHKTSVSMWVFRASYKPGAFGVETRSVTVWANLFGNLQVDLL